MVRYPCTSLPGVTPELHLHATFCPVWQIIIAMQTACCKCQAIHNSSIQFVSVVVMSTARPAALVCPPLGDGLQLRVPHLQQRSGVYVTVHNVIDKLYSHHPPHVGCPRLTRLLPLGHAPPELVVLVQDPPPPLCRQTPGPGLAAAVRGGALGRVLEIYSHLHRFN